jgi:hypothetical protein
MCSLLASECCSKQAAFPMQETFSQEYLKPTIPLYWNHQSALFLKITLPSGMTPEVGDLH